MTLEATSNDGRSESEKILAVRVPISEDSINLVSLLLSSTLEFDKEVQLGVKQADF